MADLPGVAWRGEQGVVEGSLAPPIQDLDGLPLPDVTLLPAGIFVVVLLLNLVCPNVWCMRLCPLGAAHDLLGIAKTKVRRKHSSPASHADKGFGRRIFLGMLVGGIAGFAARRVLGRGETLPLRPPGSVPEGSVVMVRPPRHTSSTTRIRRCVSSSSCGN